MHVFVDKMSNKIEEQYENQNLVDQIIININIFTIL